MLNNYFDYDTLSGSQLSNAKKRALVVSAAVEIAKASVSASSHSLSPDRVEDCLAGVEKQIESLANAIENALRIK